MNEAKAELRQKMRERVKQCAMTGGDTSRQFLQSIYAIPGIEGTDTVFAFFPYAGEPDITPAISRMIDEGRTVAVPRITGEDLTFHAINSVTGDFLPGAFGIPEPDSSWPTLFPEQSHLIRFPAVILMPGLAFSREGSRLGRGRGYYDRFLSDFLSHFAERRREITLAGVCWEAQIIEDIPVESHDIRVNCLCTEKNCILI
ncbi:5-formyltetrahydrofolate cyclo-ligase [Brucepastera parasyntrophica]|uniref:5-formyltetrahydrofolate cyclo-ligase n=1 Tax=Brucepastera parasyntrophica TaxID=2880008 RepID=UPI00210D1619|nr:5-formyltetrahydrofolate cyclo-ligase [Brucepastera parasyntrophica]ULQ60385.1 5-formyltetrahydrofolate cyclo-ligase [Brucepastera parasyntrophica]